MTQPLDIVVPGLLEEIKKSGAQIHQTNQYLNTLMGLNRKQKESVGKLQQSMRKGERLKDDLADFCFFNYGADMPLKLPHVKVFVDELQKYEGQLMVIDYSGFDWTTTQIVDGKMSCGREEQRIELARLGNPVYKIKMPERNLITQTTGQRIFSSHSGWRDSGEIGLDVFLCSFLGSQTSATNGMADTLYTELLKHAPKGFVPNPPGFRVGVYSPIITDFSQMPIGGSTKYDKEPHLYLVVGNEATKHYLSQQDLTVRRNVTEQPKIPEV